MCLPGAWIADVRDRLEACNCRRGDQAHCLPERWGNDVSRHRIRSEERFRRFREVLDKVRDRSGFPVVCGVEQLLACDRRQSRAMALNCQLTEHCKANGWAFVDNWSSFYDQDHLYLRVGLHLSQRGIQILSESLEREMSALQDFFM